MPPPAKSASVGIVGLFPPWVDTLLIASVVLLAFLPGIFGEFVTWDDDRNFLFNPAYRGLGWQQLTWMFTTSHMGPYVPLTWLTLGGDYVVWGMRPLGYHLTSLGFHAVNAVVLLFVARRLLRAALPALPVAALRLGAAAASLGFAVHPLRVESVTWITERRDVVSGLFFLLAVLAYLKSLQDDGATRSRWYWASVACFVAALLSKAIVVTLPVVLLLLDIYPLRRLGGTAGWTGPGARRVYAEKLPFVLLAAAGSAAAFAALKHIDNMPSWDAFGTAPRLAVSLYGLVFYLSKTLWPVWLSPLYELPQRVRPLAWVFVVSGALVLVAMLTAVAVRRRWPAVTAAWCFYVVSLIPVLGLFQNGPQIAADRYTYLPCLAWAVLAGTGVAWSAATWMSGGRRRTTGLALVAATLAAIALVALTARQSLVWHDSYRLWRHALAVDPTSARAHTGLAVTLTRDGRPKEALGHLERAIQLNPDLPEALAGLAATLSMMDRTEEALSYARLAVIRRPGDPGLHGVLGEILRMRGELPAAVAAFGEATRLAPDSAGNHYDLAATLAALGRRSEAVAALEAGRHAARRVQRHDPEGDRAEGRVYAGIDPARAIAAWERYLTAVGGDSDPTVASIGRMVEGLAALDELRAQVPPATAR